MSTHTLLPSVSAFMHAEQQHMMQAAPSSAAGQVMTNGRAGHLYSSNRNDVTIVLRTWDRGVKAAPDSDTLGSFPGDTRQERLQQAIASILAKGSTEKEPRRAARLANTRGEDVAAAGGRDGSSTLSAARMPPRRQEVSGPESQEDYTGSHMNQGTRWRASNSFPESSTLSLAGKIQVGDSLL